MIRTSASFLEKALKLPGVKSFTARRMLYPKRHGKFNTPPKRFFRKYEINHFLIQGHSCFSLSSIKTPTIHILYFHGGAYTMQANKMHWRLMGFLLNRIPCMVTFVNYPLAPEHTCLSTVAMVRAAYRHACQPGQRIVLMGDSAGGGLALVLAQSLQGKELCPKPDKIVLFSPWLDVSMDQDLPQALEMADLLLKKQTLQTVGKIYAGGLDTKSPLCSPLYGSFSKLGAIALFTGTRDILNVQAKLLQDKLAGHPGGFDYCEYPDMQHVWVGFPIPESTCALEKALAFIQTP